MRRYITLGADERGEVYGLELDAGTWRRNPLGLSTSCVVVRPITKSSYKYMIEDPQSAKEQWQAAVAADQTEQGLDDWFDGLDKSGLVDTSWVFGLLDDEDNPTVSEWYAGGDRSGESFRDHVRKLLVEADAVTGVESDDDAYEWEAGGSFPPSRPFAVELAPRELHDGYYAHLRETYGGFA